MRDGAPYVYQAAFVDGELARARRLSRAAAGRRLRGRSTPSSRATRKPGARAPALLLHRADRADPGRAGRRRCTSSTGSASARPSGRTTSSPTTGGSSERFLDAVVERAADTYPYPVDHCVALRLPRALQGAVAATTTTSRSSPGCRALQVERLTAGGIATLEALGDAPPSTQIPKIRPQTLRDAAPPGRAPAPPPRDRRAPRRPVLPLEPEPRLRAAARAEPGRHLARLRGRSLVRAGARARVPARLGLPRRRRRAALRAASGRATAPRRRRRSSG